jgi:hypothetical protein
MIVILSSRLSSKSEICKFIHFLNSNFGSFTAPPNDHTLDELCLVTIRSPLAFILGISQPSSFLTMVDEILEY